MSEKNKILGPSVGCKIEKIDIKQEIDKANPYFYRSGKYIYV